MYCTSRRKGVRGIEVLLKQHKFWENRLYYREKGQGYKNIVQSVMPDVLIKDDCRSVGGSWQMCIRKVNPVLRTRIKSIIVPELKRIDSLSVSWRDLL